MNSQKNQLLRKIWHWIKVASLLFALIGGGYLIYQWWNRKQELAKLQAQLEQKKQEAQQQYQLQQEHLISLTPLVDNPAIHSFFTDLLNTYAKKFADSQNIDISPLPVTFGGFYYDPSAGDGLGTMGQCFFHQITYPRHAKEIEITLNRLYLLNKFNHDRYFATHPQHGDYYYIDISFDKMIDTCSHELVHYIQFIKHGKSSCKSDLKLGRKTYNPELAQEHEKFTEEIYGMIRNSGKYSEWEKRWKEID